MRRVALTVLLAVVVAVPAVAGDIVLTPELTEGQFETLAEVLSDAMIFPTAGAAEPLGVTGFQILGLAGGPKVSDGDAWWRHGIAGDTTMGVASAERVVVRKGLPARIDLGAQAGRMFGDRFWGGELRWALLEGGTISPAVGLRATYTRLDSAALDLDVTEVQLAVSKGFLMLTPYASVGYRRSSAEAVWTGPADEAIFASVENDRATASAGVRLGLFPFQVLAEVRKGKEMSYFVGLGVGL